MTDTEPTPGKPYVAPGSPRNLTAAALHTAAELVRLGPIPLPSSIDIWTHDIGRDQLLTIADRYEARVAIRPKTPECHAYAMVSLGETLTGVYRTTFKIASQDMGESDIRMYEDHNRECLPERTAHCTPISLVPAPDHDA